ncbi:MAG: polyketide synthase, partial [Frankiales bacterium]|nr:polyketide synthase [Frankiales bacterium]
LAVAAPAPGGSDADARVAEYLRSSRELVAAQRDVLLAYLGGTPSPAPAREPAAPLPVLAPAAVHAPVRVSVQQLVVDVVAERTGYPADMIEPDADLESDLSVDSIKRAEVVGLLVRRLVADGHPGLADLRDAELEELTRARTVSAIASWLEARTVPALPAQRVPVDAPAPARAPQGVLDVVVEVVAERTGYPADMIEPDADLESDLSIDSIKRAEIVGLLVRRLVAEGRSELAGLGDGELEELTRARTAAAVTAWVLTRTSATAAAPAAEPDVVVGTVPVRLTARLEPLSVEQATADVLTGRRLLLLGDDGCGAAASVQGRLPGTEVLLRPASHVLSAQDGPVDGVVLLEPLGLDGAPVLPACVPALQAALARPLRCLLLLQHRQDLTGRGDGLRGLARSLAQEYPDTTVRVVEVDPGEEVADVVRAELLAPDREPVVVRDGAGRAAPRLLPAPLGLLASRGAGPADDGRAEAAALGLDADAVVLLVGGARGITARFAATLAAAGRCRLELLGRTPVSGTLEDPTTAGALDRQALRAVLARGGTPLADVDRTASRLLAAREVEATLRELSGLGATARYRAVDATDAAALRQLVKDVHAEHGRLDGVVFAAGVLEDRLFADKDPASFDRVFRAKADGARALLDALDDLPAPPAFTVFFGSVAAAFGNRGQADYAAANDAVDAQASRWADRTGNRALTVHWGPWAPDGVHGGMVSPELARDYARRGVALVDPAAGTSALLRELAYGEPATRSVVYTASGW